jgi:dsDNA-specific endonuclease/ATPase MutS2
VVGLVVWIWVIALRAIRAWGPGPEKLLVWLVTAGVLTLAAVVLWRRMERSRPQQRAQESEEGRESLAEPDPEQPVTLPLEDALDLHTFHPKEVPEAVREYLFAVHAAGHREVRLIHGRGTGLQRERVRSVLAHHPLVAAFHDAPPSRGGWGATIVYLKDEGSRSGP